HLHHLLPAEAAPAEGALDRDGRGLAAGRGGVPYQQRAAFGGDRGAGPAPGLGGQGRSGRAARGLPDAGLSRRWRGVRLQGARRGLRCGLAARCAGELPGEIVARRARRTRGCPGWAEEWERLRRIKELVRRSCAERAPRALRERTTVEYRSVQTTGTETGRTTTSSVRVTSTRLEPPQE